MRFAAFWAMLVLAAPAHALDMPVEGAYGADAVQCGAAREKRKGAYVVFSGASVGHGGEGGCDVSVIRKIGPNEWALVGACATARGAKTLRTLRLARRDKLEIEYDGRPYRACAR